MPVVGSVLLLSGCLSSTFVLTDARAVGRTPTQPAAYIDRLPPMPFYSIGVIEVRAPAGTELGVVLNEAIRKGAEVGCDMVVDRSIYRVSYGIPGARAIVAQVGVYPSVAPPPVIYANPPAPDRREFICGVVAGPPVGTPPPIQPKAASSNGSARLPGHISLTTDVRSAPSSVAPKLTALAAGQEVTVSRELSDGWRVVFLPGGRVGYVPDNTVQLDPPR